MTYIYRTFYIDIKCHKDIFGIPDAFHIPMDYNLQIFIVPI